ncbi:GTP-binding protein [Halosquirtibacter xylanolyticus]|uniref:GTP-binding protein n=1 Tax=Halosquirtibacter xylanolyticus TaxID=3374599 RepID=UPI003747889E|nr:GTP-binding protein [Prolixibacteraceae bacterium]
MKRVEIGIFGRMNAGKSTLMNLLTQQETSIVDSTPGTTADHKITLFELHGIGPCKIFDTPGIDETSILGQKKRNKVIQTLKECDLVVITTPTDVQDKTVEEELISLATKYNKPFVIVENQINENRSTGQLTHFISEDHFISKNLLQKDVRNELISFIKRHLKTNKESTSLLPFLKKGHSYLLIIPMDEETPEKRLLRPQNMALEEITRSWAYAITYRLDLNKARGNDSTEKERFTSFVSQIPFLDVVITDSQAMDIVHDWLPDSISLTTFSIMMIQHATQKLPLFYDGIKQWQQVKSDGNILICEACNHSRIQEDIGTVQIPKILKKQKPDIHIDFSFGREFEDKNIEEYDLVIHCGGCMISSQKLNRRVLDLEEFNIPITNYGIFLSWAKGMNALDRVMKPWL